MPDRAFEGPGAPDHPPVPQGGAAAQPPTSPTPDPTAPGLAGSGEVLPIPRAAVEPGATDHGIAAHPHEVPPSLQVRLFGSHAFFRLWLAQVVSSLGDWIGFVAIVAVAERVGGSSPEAAIGLVMSARIIPGLFLASVAGVLVDRWDRKKVMVTCDLGRAAVLATLPFIDSVAALVAASLLLEIGTLFWSPAKDASVPNLVPTEHLTTANSLSLVAAYGTFPVASLVFAGLTKLAEWLSGFSLLSFLDASSESLAIGFDVLTFVVSALMIATLPLVRRPKRIDGEKRIDLIQAFHELKEGWRYIAVSPQVRAVIVGAGAGLFGGGMLVPLGPVFATAAVGSGPAGFGLLLTALGTGMAIGVVALSIMQRRLNKPRAFSLSLFGAGLFLIVGASTSSLGPAFVFVLGLGVCAGSVYVLAFTVLQESVSDELRGRIFSTLYAVVRLCLVAAFALGPFFSGLLDEVFRFLFDNEVSVAGAAYALPGVRSALWMAGLIIVASGVLAMRTLKADATPLTEPGSGSAAEPGDR